MAALVVMVTLPAAWIGAEAHLPLMRAMAAIAAWVVGPAMVLTVIAGLLSMAVHPPFQNAGWVWVKAATGILVLEGGLHVLGPIQEEAKRGAGAPVVSTSLLTAEANTLWVLLAVCVANVALGVWRPRLPEYPV